MASDEIITVAATEESQSYDYLPARTGFLESLWRFARRKPLGAACGLIILFFAIIGDLVPETINKLSQTAGIAEQPVPYVADILEKHVGAIYPYWEPHFENVLEGSSSRHLLGTDSVGRDVFSRLLFGARTAVLVSFGAVLISAVLQVLISVPAAYYGGWYDKIAYRMVDIVDSLPTLIVLLVVLGIFGSGLWPMIFVIGTLYGFGGRYIRGQALSIMTSPYIEAARSIGAGDMRIMTRYLIPNLMPLIILGATLRLGSIVLLEATLSFLGFGIPPPFPSWGQMLSIEGREFMRTAPGLAVYPGLVIALLVFSFNLFGDALRDVTDPRLRGNR